jgi:hypothetical protein
MWFDFSLTVHVYYLDEKEKSKHIDSTRKDTLTEWDLWKQMWNWHEAKYLIHSRLHITMGEV